MFHAEGLQLEDDHLDLDFRQSQSWTKVGPAEGSPPSLWISLGDPELGPAVQLGICPPVPEKIWLDTHYHASDQFRATISGDFQLQRKHMKAGDFGYQTSGMPYREGLVGGGSDPLWMFAVHGYRRGARSTTTRSDGSFLLGEVAEDQLDRPVDSPHDPYWAAVPGGAKGQVALAVSEGRTVGGFHWGNFDDARAWRRLSEGVTACAALFGDREAGPMILTIRAEPGATMLPAACAGSETVVAVIRGSVTIDDATYRAGEVRVQRAGAQADATAASPEGADLVYLIADRRAMPQAVSPDPASSAWLGVVTQLRRELASSFDKQRIGALSPA